jgi:hypothetical protein
VTFTIVVTPALRESQPNSIQLRFSRLSESANSGNRPRSAVPLKHSVPPYDLIFDHLLAPSDAKYEKLNLSERILKI